MSGDCEARRAAVAALDALEGAAIEAQQAIAELVGEVGHRRATDLVGLTHTTVQRWKLELPITPMLIAARKRRNDTRSQL
ncbi:MAG: hypothetical protein F4Y61_05580 [Rhodothermaceae bacterium]|nr:hypothetical protein [Rhodothermaceae bacterium]